MEGIKLDIIKEIFKKENIEGDKQFIDEFVEGLDEKGLAELKKLAMELMIWQKIHKDYYPIMYRNAFKYIACRRLYKTEIQTCTQKSILGDYFSKDIGRWVTLKEVD